MIKRLFLFLAVIFFSAALFSQKINVVVKYVSDDGTGNTNKIFYKPNQLLTWKDFTGKPVEGSNASAMTNAGFGLTLSFHSSGNASQLEIPVNCHFSKKDSWVKEGNQTAYMLNHEQKHFDIAYVHTCKFIQNLKEANITKANYEAVIGKIYTEAVTAMSKMQNQYDLETSHSRIAEKQAEWDIEVSKLLASYLTL